MGREIVYCELCGERILEDQFEKGRAVTLLNKNYCENCKGKAARTIGVDDAFTAEAAAPARHAPAPSEFLRSQKTAPAPPVSARRVSTQKRFAHDQSRTVTFVMIGGGVALFIVLVLLFSSGREKPTLSNIPQKATSPPPLPPAPDELAATELARLRALVSHGTASSTVLTEIAKAKMVITGPPRRAELDDLEAQIRRNMARAGDREVVVQLIAELGRLTTEDALFDRFLEVRKRIDDARALTQLKLPELGPDLARAELAYMKRYNEVAGSFYELAHKLAEELAGQKKYAEAVRMIHDKFPAKFQRSTYWQSLSMDLSRYELEAAKQKSPNPPRETATPVVFPTLPLPPVGQSTTLFDGKTMDLWHRYRRGEEREGNWLVQDGTITGESSYPAAAPGVKEAMNDIVVLKFDQLTDYELEFKVKVERGNLIMGARFWQRDGKNTSSGFKLGPTDWTTVRVVYEGTLASKSVGNEPLRSMTSANWGDRGRIFFGLYPNGKARLKDLKLVRKK